MDQTSTLQKSQLFAKQMVKQETTGDTKKHAPFVGRLPHFLVESLKGPAPSEEKTPAERAPLRPSAKIPFPSGAPPKGESMGCAQRDLALKPKVR